MLPRAVLVHSQEAPVDSDYRNGMLVWMKGKKLLQER